MSDYIYRVSSDDYIGSVKLRDVLAGAGFETGVDALASGSMDYNSPSVDAQLEDYRVQIIGCTTELAASREALVKSAETSLSNRNMYYEAKNKTAKVLDTVRDHIIDNGEECFPSGFVDAMVALGMEPMVGTRELTITYNVVKKYTVTLDNVPVDADDDDLVRWLSRIDVDAGDEARDLDTRVTQELRMEGYDDIEVDVSEYDSGDIADFEVEMA